MNKTTLFALTFLLPLMAFAEDKLIRNHTVWLNTNGKPVSCHGGGIMREGDTFYWYGEAFIGNPEGHFGHAVPEHGLRYTDVQNGFNCYSSKQLVDWKFVVTH